MQSLMLACFVIIPHEQHFLPAGFIFVHQLDDAGRFFLVWVSIFSLFSGQAPTYGCFKCVPDFDTANINCNSTDLK